MIQEEYKGLYITVESDPDAQSPRQDYDCFGTLVGFGRYSYIGDKHEFKTTQDLDKYMKRNNCLKLPVYMYVHSGMTISTAPYSCPWDSGQLGYIYVTPENVRKEYNVKRISKKIRDKAIALLEREVKQLDKYLVEGMYCFLVKDADDEVVDSCCGFDDEADCLTEAKAAADSYINSLTKA